MNNPKQAAMETMKATVQFYDADWCGILDVDVDADVGVWKPVWWYNKEYGEMARTYFSKFEFLDGYKRWLDCYEKHEPIVITDVEDVRDEYPDEYKLYQRLQTNSLLAVPFWKGVNGFLVVRNPKKYKTHTSLLRMLNYPIVCSLNEYYLMESGKLSIISPKIRNERDVYISLFGEMEITTVKGALTEREMKSSKQAKLLAYILLNKKIASSPRELAEALWEDEDTENTIKKMKGFVYRLQQVFTLLSDFRLIESTPNGYQLNHELNVFTDYQLFENKIAVALYTTDREEKIEALKKAVDLYKGALFENYRQEHWLMSMAVAYEYKYIGALGELLKALDEDKDYAGIQYYAANALRIVPHNADAYYWTIYAMYQMNRAEMGRNQLKLAQSNLLAEEYEELTESLKAGGFLQYC